MSQFEDFVSLELPKRRPLLKPADVGNYDGDPNLSTNPVLVGSPLGTWYHEPTADVFWTKDGSGTWQEVGGGEDATEATGVTIVTVSTAGSDTDPNRPLKILTGDWTANPFLTIQAAVNALPKLSNYATTINVLSAGNYAGFSLKGFLHPGGLTVNGLQGTVTPTTGPASGTATSGTTKSLTRTGSGWTVDDFVGKFCKIVSGTGSGQVFIIATNTTDTLTFAGRMSPAPNATSVFEITEPKTIITSAFEFNAGIYHHQSVGTFTVQDFHIQGPTYGVVALRAQSAFTLRRITAKTVTTGFLAQESLKVAWSQIGCLASTSHGISFTAVTQIGATDKGWLVVNASGASTKGISIVNSRGGAQGVYVKTTGWHGVYVTRSVIDFSYLEAYSAGTGGDGLNVAQADVWLFEGILSNNTRHGIALDYSGRIDISTGIVSGSGNGGWGLHAGLGIGGIVALLSVPTITGTSGNCTVDGTTALVWATDFNAVNEYAYNIARDARIVRSA